MESVELHNQSQPLSDDEAIARLAECYRQIIEIVGEDSTREGLLRTPVRAAKALWSVTGGYRRSLEETVGDAVFECQQREMVIVKDIEYYSLCEHHILPFFGHVSVGYLPKGKILGLSKLARIVDLYARRLQVQERLTDEICQAVARVLPTDGVMVSISGEHLCMKMRGVEKQDSATVTIATSGRFATDPSLRAEFLAAIR